MKRYPLKHLCAALLVFAFLLSANISKASEGLQLKSTAIKTGAGHSLGPAQPSMQLSMSGEFTMPWLPFISVLGLSARKTSINQTLSRANISLDFSFAYELDHLSWIPGVAAGGRLFGVKSQTFLTGTTYVKRVYPSGYSLCISAEFAQTLSQQDKSFITYLVGVGYDFDMNRF